MEIIKCDICKKENEKDRHYCVNCGKNLSKIIEKTDVLFFISNLLKVVGILLLIIYVPGMFLIEGILSLDNNTVIRSSGYMFIISILMIVIGSIIKKNTLKLCKNNLMNEIKK